MLHRSSVPTDPGDNLKAAEAFFLVVLHAHIVAAAKVILSQKNTTDVAAISKQIVEQYITIDVPSVTESVSVKYKDKVYLYAVELMTLGMLWHNFHDSIKEADGNRLIRNWKFNLLIFKAAGRNNYSKEALNLLLQINYFLSPRESAQLKWCRCVNTSGQQGTNISMDLYLEHLNRRLKAALRNAGSNITDNSVSLAAESISILQHICEQFERETCTSTPSSDKHSFPSFEKDLRLILNVLEDQEVFIEKSPRKHPSFNMTNKLVQQIPHTELVKWIKKTTMSLVNSL